MLLGPGDDLQTRLHLREELEPLLLAVELQLSASHFPKRLHALTILASSKMSPTDIPSPDACAASETSYMMRALTSRINASPCLWQ